MISLAKAGNPKIIENCKCALIGAQNSTAAQSAMPDRFTTRNLFHFLKKKLYKVDEITDFVSRLSDKERYIGYLPEKWREKLDSKDIKGQTLEVQTILSDFARKCSCKRQIYVQNLAPQAEELAKQLEKYFGECKVKPFRNGSLGKVFRIQCADEDLALKIFHNNPPKRFLSAHGQTKEIANAAYLSHTMKPNQCSRFYCAKMGLKGDSDAFMLTGFAKEGSASSRQWSLWDCRRFRFNDGKGENFVGNKLVDFGAVYYNFENINQLAYAKELYPLIQSGRTKEVLKLKRKYTGDEDFEAVLKAAKKVMEDQLDSAYCFAVRVQEGSITKKQIETCEALGVDFNGIRYADVGLEELCNALESVGLRPKKGLRNLFSLK